MNKIRLGIIGCGSIVRSTHLPLLAAMPNVHLAFLADVSPPQDLEKQYQTPAAGVEDLNTLPPCDVVFLAVPVGVREKYIHFFGEKKIPIFTEKPFAVDAKAHRQFLKWSAHIRCNYMRELYDATQQMREILAQKTFGAIQKIEISEGGITSSTGKSTGHYQTNLNLSGGGVLTEKGCHPLSQLAYVLNYPALELEDARVVYQKGLDVDADVHFTAKTKGGKVPIHLCVSAIKPLAPLFRVTCEQGVLEMHPGNPAARIQVHQNKRTWEMEPLQNTPRTAQQAFYAKWKQFLEEVQEKSKMPTKNTTSFVITQLLDDIYNQTRGHA